MVNTIAQSDDQPKILLVDDNINLLREIEAYVKTLEVSVNFRKSSSVENTLKQIKLEQYGLILVDLRLYQGKEGEIAGLKLIETIAPQVTAQIILFTTNPTDSIIKEEINKALQTYENFPFTLGTEENEGNSVAQKADPEKLRQVIEAYVENFVKEREYRFIPESLKEKLEELKVTLQSTRNKQVFEEGRLLAKAKELIEETREELKQTMEAFPSNPNKVQQEELRVLQNQYEAVSGFWIEWVQRQFRLERTAIYSYIAYYEYFQNPKRLPYQEYINLDTQSALCRKKKRGYRKDNPSVLSESDQDFLLQMSPQIKLSRKRVLQFIKIRQKLAEKNLNLRADIVLTLAQQPPFLADSLLEQVYQLPSADYESINQLLKTYQNKFEGEQLKQKYENRRLESKTPSQWQKNTIYQWFEGQLSEALQQLDPSLVQQFGGGIIEQELWTGSLTKEIKQLQLLSLKPNRLNNLEIILECFFLGIYLPPMKVLIYVQENFFEVIRKKLAKWEKDFQNYQKIVEEGGYLMQEEQEFYEMVLSLKDNQDLYVVKYSKST